MKKNLWRSVLCAGAALVAVMGGVAPAQADSQSVWGTFSYQDLLAGQQFNVNPRVGVCYSVPTVGLAPNNYTNARVIMYLDFNCTLLGEVLEPKNFGTNAFLSYQFFPH